HDPAGADFPALRGLRYRCASRAAIDAHTRALRWLPQSDTSSHERSAQAVIALAGEQSPDIGVGGRAVDRQIDRQRRRPSEDQSSR
ncbi:hypothetical protein NL492_26855, partial [Klebsiella pneumoniae]|nr:hypothetical protein [Klebsiella pneumoniae]